MDLRLAAILLAANPSQFTRSIAYVGWKERQTRSWSPAASLPWLVPNALSSLPRRRSIKKIALMRSFPLPETLVLAALCLVPVPSWAQHLRCQPCDHSFEKVQIGTSASVTVEISNIGDKMLRISSKSEEGASFSFSPFPTPVKLEPGASTQLTVTFKPSKKGYADATLVLTSNDPNSPRTLHFAGTGFYPSSASLAVVPATLNFGNVTVGSSATPQGTLTASGAAVTISSDQSSSSEYAIIGFTVPVTIPDGQSLPFTVQFTPNASGTASAKVGFISNAVDSPTIEQVTGKGVAQAAHNVYLTWEPGEGSPVGYNIYRSTVQAGPFAEINSSLDSSTNYTDYTVVSGTTYYYVVTEVNAQGEESAYSNEAQAIIPSP